MEGLTPRLTAGRLLRQTAAVLRTDALLLREAALLLRHRITEAAVEAAENICKVNNHILAAKGVIAAPCEETRKLVALSAKRIQKKTETEQ